MSVDKTHIVTPQEALAGRDTSIEPQLPHAVFGIPLQKPAGESNAIVVGMGCFWGAERLFWKQQGVLNTAVGYAGGYTPNPSYDEVCTGQTGHTEVVVIHFDPNIISLTQLLTLFWENHDPTQGMRQGNDTGTQYRSAIYTQSEQQFTDAQSSMLEYQHALQHAKGPYSHITTEVRPLGEFYFAEEYHQQYLEKNPNGYCGLGGTGICMPPSA
ncbi:peptide-methionine (S)-S-oxide reductase MsrA [Thaumasiovibrio subtropicus]|uniref:peptide-methionine (S)-S-oxide reductase MsrA n=1 Tax=Thaumasiovibrio subtropicus TaxID=1891207 RepID=UPI000B35E576|nr:peptide-methionine (S)-S-oxide reductase MsrA [Thaumasiovibrio subtropicus]